MSTKTVGYTVERDQVLSDLVDREVIANVSMMVREVAPHGEEFPEWEDELHSAHDGGVSWARFECDECGHQYEIDGPDQSQSDRYYCPKCDNDNEPIEEDRHEVYEHYIVTEWFGSRLEGKGEKVFSLFDLTIWGRCCTGQAIKLDDVISLIYNDIQALQEGA